MIVKDYYKVLNLEAGATQQEIKKSFRNLALQYHPDITANNTFALAWYEEIQEAYNTLIDDEKRETYHQQCWYLKSIGKQPVVIKPKTAETVAQSFKAFKQQVKAMDHFRMDQKQVAKQCMILLDNSNIEVLKQYNQPNYNHDVVVNLLEIMAPLSYKHCEPIYGACTYFLEANNNDSKRLKQFMKQKKLDTLWTKYQALVWLFLAIISCVIIYHANK